MCAGPDDGAVHMHPVTLRFSSDALEYKFRRQQCTGSLDTACASWLVIVALMIASSELRSPLKIVSASHSAHTTYGNALFVSINFNATVCTMYALLLGVRWWGTRRSGAQTHVLVATVTASVHLLLLLALSGLCAPWYTIDDRNDMSDLSQIMVGTDILLSHIHGLPLQHITLVVATVMLYRCDGIVKEGNIINMHPWVLLTLRMGFTELLSYVVQSKIRASYLQRELLRQSPVPWQQSPPRHEDSKAAERSLVFGVVPERSGPFSRGAQPHHFSPIVVPAGPASEASFGRAPPAVSSPQAGTPLPFDALGPTLPNPFSTPPRLQPRSDPPGGRFWLPDAAQLPNPFSAQPVAKGPPGNVAAGAVAFPDPFLQPRVGSGPKDSSQPQSAAVEPAPLSTIDAHRFCEPRPSRIERRSSDDDSFADDRASPLPAEPNGLVSWVDGSSEWPALALGSVCAVLVACALGSLVGEEPRHLPSARSTNPLVAVANAAIATAAEAAGGYAEIMVVGLALVVVVLPVVWVFPMLCSWCSCLRCANPPHAGCSHDVAHPRTAPESGACAEGSLLAGRRPLQEAAAYPDAPPNDGMRRSLNRPRALGLPELKRRSSHDSNGSARSSLEPGPPLVDLSAAHDWRGVVHKWARSCRGESLEQQVSARIFAEDLVLQQASMSLPFVLALGGALGDRSPLVAICACVAPAVLIGWRLWLHSLPDHRRAARLGFATILSLHMLQDWLVPQSAPIGPVGLPLDTTASSDGQALATLALLQALHGVALATFAPSVPQRLVASASHAVALALLPSPPPVPDGGRGSRGLALLQGPSAVLLVAYTAVSRALPTNALRQGGSGAQRRAELRRERVRACP